jgi:formylmethanofuran dehydrogenase subunit C
MDDHAFTRRRLLGAGAAALPAALAGCSVPAQTVSDSTTRTIDVADADRAVVVNQNGRVTVRGGDRDDAELTVEKRSQHGEDLLERTAVGHTVADGTLRIETDVQTNFGESMPTVRLTLSLPSDLPLHRVTTTNGTVTASGVAGDPRLESTNGDVAAEGVGGFVTLVSTNGSVRGETVDGLDRAETVNGDVDVEVPALRGDATLATTNGGITAALSQGLDATVTASTDNGTVDADDLGFADVSTGGNNFSGRLNGGEHDLTATTTNGDVRFVGLETSE